MKRGHLRPLYAPLWSCGCVGRYGIRDAAYKGGWGNDMGKFAILLACIAVAAAPSLASAATKATTKHHAMKHHAMKHHAMKHQVMVAKKDRRLFEDMFSGK
jgi:hypothetical protein